MARDLPYLSNGTAKAEPSDRAGESSIARRSPPAFPPVLGEMIMGRYVFDYLIPPVSRGVLQGSLVAAASIALVFTLDYVVGLMFEARRSASRFLDRSRSTRANAVRSPRRTASIDDPRAFADLSGKTSGVDRPNGRRIVLHNHRTPHGPLRIADLSFDRPC